MSFLYPLIFVSVLILILGVISLLILRFLTPELWRLRWSKVTIYLGVILGLVSAAVWAIGFYVNALWLFRISALTLASSILFLLAVIISLPLSALFKLIINLIFKIKDLRFSTGEKRKTNNERRRIIRAASLFFPSLALSTAAGGMIRSYRGAELPEIRMKFPHLPEHLENLKIMQFSDIHLGYFVDLDDLSSTVEDAMKLKPDLVLVTGDVADRLEMLPDALRIIAEMNPLLGVYACMGNHEYYRGEKEVRQAFEKAPIEMMINSSKSLKMQNGTFTLAGVDDPIFMRNVSPEFYTDALEETMSEAPADEFKILMCHRPDGFDFSAEMGIELTLSGHTHGGQIGFNGRSIFENWVYYPYLWGIYRKSNGSNLYTTAGLGHWLPFRLGCPPEVPLIILERN
ncbi:MAG: hypothetical protein GF315_08470 [candidate division Zixibacteria bacterium]|nr:hypothetical protein [candidate division Zixibacteria bacterium]